MILPLCPCYLLWRETHLHLCIRLVWLFKRSTKLPCGTKIDCWTESLTILFYRVTMLSRISFRISHSLSVKRWTKLCNLLWLLVFLRFWNFPSRKSHDFLSFIGSTARYHFFVDTTYFITIFWQSELFKHLLAFYNELSLAIFNLMIAVWVTLPGTILQIFVFTAKGALCGTMRTRLSKALHYFTSHDSKVISIITRQGLLTVISGAYTAAIELVSNLWGLVLIGPLSIGGISVMILRTWHFKRGQNTVLFLTAFDIYHLFKIFIDNFINFPKRFCY